MQFLGVFIDDKLNWNKQISNACSKLSSAIEILNKDKFKLNTKTLIL